MKNNDTVVAVFAEHEVAETAIKKLAQDGFDMKSLSVVGRGYHTDEKVVGFYNVGDRVKFWGLRGAFWGGLWGLFFGGIFITIPTVGPIVLLGYLATLVMTAIDNALILGGLSALGAAIYSIGVPKDSVIEYENDVKAEGFLIMVHGDASEVARAKEILGTLKPSRLNIHPFVKVAQAA